MREQRVYRCEAVVLRGRRLGEADKILTLFSAERGKFDAVAKGVLRPNSRKAGHVEPLTHVAMQLARGRNLDVITQGEAIQTFLPLRDDLRRLSCGLYVAEVVERFTIEEQESYAVFRLFVQTLGLLATTNDPDLILRHFEITLLALSGYRPELRVCVVCGRPLEAVTNSFSPAAGGVMCPSCTPERAAARPLSVNALKILRLLQDGRLAEAMRVRLAHDLTVEVERHLRAWLRVYLERDLGSLEFMNAVRRDRPVPVPVLS